MTRVGRRQIELEEDIAHVLVDCPSEMTSLSAIAVLPRPSAIRASTHVRAVQPVSPGTSTLGTARRSPAGPVSFVACDIVGFLLLLTRCITP